MTDGAGDGALRLGPGRLLDGVWQAVLSGRPEGASQPEIEVTHLDRPVTGVEVTERPGGDWSVRIPVAPEHLADGIQTFLILDRRTGARLGSFAIVAGETLEPDVRAEIDLLRAELDMLKRAFRRHCVETGAGV